MLEPVISNKAGWTRVAFGDVVRLSKLRAKDPEAEGYERVVGLEHIEPGDLRIRRWADIADGTTFTSVFKPGQVLFGKRRAYQRKVAVADFEGVCSGDIYVLEPSSDALMPELLPFICQTDAFFDHAVGTSAGSLSPRTNWKSLADFEFLLPPIQEQARLVECFSSVDTLINAQTDAKTALQKVIEAELLSEFPSDEKNAATLPLDQLIGTGVLDLQTGPFGTVLSAKEYSDEGVPIVNPSDIENGELRHLSGKFVPEQRLSTLGKYLIEMDDLILSRKAEIDKIALAKHTHNGWVLGSDCIRLRFDTNSILPEYFLLFMRSAGTSRLLRSYSHGSIMPGLNEKMLSNLEFPQTFLEDQVSFASKIFKQYEVLLQIDLRIESTIELRKITIEAAVAGETS
jgi:type I restriction enzyme S subunit